MHLNIFTYVVLLNVTKQTKVHQQFNFLSFNSKILIVLM